MNTAFPTSRQLKEQARTLHRASASRLTRVTLLYWLLGFALTDLISYIAALFLPVSQDTVSGPELFLSLLLSLFGVVLAYGYDRWIFWTSRGNQLGYDTLLDGFSEVGRVILARIWIVLYLLPWAFFLCIGAVLLFAILFDFFVYVLTFYGLTALSSLMFLYFVPVYFILYLISLRYELTNFLLAEFSELTSSQAVRRSAQLMQGHLGRLFRLKLSFLGWHLLSAALVLGVGAAAAYPQLANLLQTLRSAGTDWSVYLQQLPAIFGSGPVTILTTLVCLPVFLFLTPYQRLTEARFYTRLIRPEPEPENFSASF